MPAGELKEYEPGKLDAVRLEQGPDKLLEYFGKIARVHKNKAVAQINDETLQFPTLYLVRPILSGTGLLGRINGKKRLAVRLSNAISRKDSPCVNFLVKTYKPQIQDALRWILYSGCADDGLENKYDEILELSAALLACHYRDSSVLPAVAELIFKRHRKGLLIHNLVWAFFEARYPDSLLLLANYTYSRDGRDRELACRLLGFIPCVERNRTADRASMFNEVTQWIQENSMFLYHTGECLHMTANPIPFALSFEAKYLCKPVSPEDGKPFRDNTVDEEKLLEPFRALDPVMRMRLAAFSHMLYKRNARQWDEWIRFPIQDQLRTMKMSTGGR